MKTLRQVGLIVEGNSTRSLILRLPGLADEIGPIKATTARVARRVSNFLRAGEAVAGYEELDGCEVILMRIPDASVGRVVGEICRSELPLAGACFGLCETWLSSDALLPLKQRGAFVATVSPLPTQQRNWFGVEGGQAAINRIRRVLSHSDARTIELREGTKHLYFAATVLAATLPRALLTAAQQALRGSGVRGKHLGAVIEEMAHGMIGDMARGSRAGWSGPLIDCPPELVAAYVAQLRESTPELGQFLAEQIRLAKPFVPSRGHHEAKKRAAK